jgi:serine phosphatase RsbU (regulator of sigma subunit)
MKKSLTLRIFTVHFLLLAFPLLFVSFFFFHRSFEIKVESLREKLDDQAQQLNYLIEDLEPLSDRTLNDILLFLPSDIKAADQALAKLNNLFPNLLIFLTKISENGSGPSFLKQSALFKDEDFNKMIAKGSGSFIRYLQSQNNPTAQLYYIVGRVFQVSRDQEAYLLLCMRNIQSEVDTVISKSFELGINLAILNKQKVVLASSNPRFLGAFLDPLTQNDRQQLADAKVLADTPLFQAPLQLISSRPTGSSDFIFDGKSYYAVNQGLEEVPFSSLLFVAKNVIFWDTFKQFIWIYLVYAIVLTLGIVIAYYLSYLVAKPMRDLTQVMQRAYEGNIKIRFKESPLAFELNSLGSLFNDTLQALEKNMLQAEEERLSKEKYQKEIEVGRKAQQNLLLIQVPQNPYVEISARYLQATDVGGDFYFAESPRKGVFSLVVGDAAGKGISSCLYALSVRSLIRSYSRVFSNVGEVLSATNNAFCEQTADSGMFVTTLMGQYDVKTAKLNYFCCGHPPGFIKRHQGPVEALKHSGRALGLCPSTPFSTENVQLEEGDIVILFSKGLIENYNLKNRSFSKSKVLTILQQRPWQTAESVVQGLCSELQEFMSGTDLEEEVVILAMQVKKRLNE